MDIAAVLTTVGASNIFVVLANLGRYVAIHWPFRYDQLASRKNIAIVISSAWFFFFCVGLCPVLGWNNWSSDANCDFISVMSIGLSFIVVVIYMSMFFGLLLVNARIFWTASKHAKRIAGARNHLRIPAVGLPTVDESVRSQSSVTASDSRTSCEDESSTSSVTSTSSGRTQRKLSRSSINVKAARVVPIVVGVYGLCHFPTACVMTHQLILRLQGHDSHSICTIFSYVLILTFLNSGMNPLIYYLAMPGFRDSYRKLLCSWGTRRDQSP